MIIRSQCREFISIFNQSIRIEIDENNGNFVIWDCKTEEEYLLGKYSTKEKAMKVLNEIQQYYVNFISVDGWKKVAYAEYVMPQDKDVKC